MGIKHTEYWELKCNKCCRYLYNKETDDSIFFKFNYMTALAYSKGWIRRPGFVWLCDECKKEKNNVDN